MTWLRAHWLAVLIGVAVGGSSAWHLKPDPQPAIALKQDTAAASKADTTIAKKDTKAPSSLVRKVYRTDCAPGSPPVLVSETVLERGPEVLTTDTHSRSEEQLVTHLDLRVDPPRPPRWALGAGLEDPLGARRVRVEGGMRLLGPVWLRAGIAPARGLGSATVGLEVTW